MRIAPGLLLVPALLAGCAADRPFKSTMTLAPGQAATGRFEIPDGATGFVAFQRQDPVRGVEPHPESWSWVSDGKVRLTFESEPSASVDSPLGYASVVLKEGRTCQVVVRNADAEPASFDWIVKGSPGVRVKWDFSEAAPAK